MNVRYASARTPGGWKAHGTYIERESAKGDRLPTEKQTGAEIDSQTPDPDRLDWRRSTRLDGWRKAGRRPGTSAFSKSSFLRKIRTSDFQRTAADMIARIEQHTGAPVEWGGVVHRNTDHPHAHIIVRGRLRIRGAAETSTGPDSQGAPREPSKAL